MQTITLTDLKNNVGKFALLGAQEEIIITKNGRPISKISPINDTKRAERLAIAESIIGIIPPMSDNDIEMLKEERIGV